MINWRSCVDYLRLIVKIANIQALVAPESARQGVFHLEWFIVKVIYKITLILSFQKWKIVKNNLPDTK